MAEKVYNAFRITYTEATEPLTVADLELTSANLGALLAVLTGEANEMIRRDGTPEYAANFRLRDSKAAFVAARNIPIVSIDYHSPLQIVLDLAAYPALAGGIGGVMYTLANRWAKIRVTLAKTKTAVAYESLTQESIELLKLHLTSTHQKELLEYVTDHNQAALSDATEALNGIQSIEHLPR